MRYCLVIFIAFVISTSSESTECAVDLAELAFSKKHVSELSLADAFELENISKESEDKELDIRLLILWGVKRDGNLETFWKKIDEINCIERKNIYYVQKFLSGEHVFGPAFSLFSFYDHGGTSLVLPSGFSSLKYYFTGVVSVSNDHSIEALETKLRSKDNNQVAHDARALLIELNAKGFSQESMATMFNVSQTTVSRFINKKAFCLKLILNVRAYYMNGGDSLFPQSIVFKPRVDQKTETHIKFEAHPKSE